MDLPAREDQGKMCRDICTVLSFLSSSKLEDIASATGRRKYYRAL